MFIDYGENIFARSIDMLLRRKVRKNNKDYRNGYKDGFWMGHDEGYKKAISEMQNEFHGKLEDFIMNLQGDFKKTFEANINIVQETEGTRDLSTGEFMNYVTVKAYPTIECVAHYTIKKNAFRPELTPWEL